MNTQKVCYPDNVDFLAFQKGLSEAQKKIDSMMVLSEEASRKFLPMAEEYQARVKKKATNRAKKNDWINWLKSRKENRHG